MIEVRNAYLTYLNGKKKVDVLKNINISFPSRGLFFIYGKSGSGKSSLLSLLEGINNPSKGNVYFNNKDIYKMNKNELSIYYQNIGILFQNSNLLEELSVKENLKLISNNEERINELLKDYKLENSVNEKVYNLSGGEKQRLSLIRAIINNPKIVFADEPTGALDEDNSNFIFDELYKLSKNILVIVVSHNEKYFDKYDSNKILIDNGKTEAINFIDKNKKSEFKFASNNLNNYYPLKMTLLEGKKSSILIILSFIFTMISLLFTLTFKNSFNIYKYKIYDEFYVNNVFYASSITNKNVNSSLIKIVKKQTVDEVKLKDAISFNNIEYKLYKNLNYFIDSNTLNLNNKKYSNIELYPSFDNDFLSNDLIINSSFQEKYNLKVDDNIIINFDKKIILKINDSKLDVDINYFLEFKIKEVVNEFNFMSAPRSYYSYFYLKDNLKNLPCYDVSNYLNDGKYIYDLLDYEDENQEITSYSSFFISNCVKELEYNEILKNNLKNNNIEISSDPLMIVESFNSFIKSLLDSINFFIIFIFLTMISIQILINFSSINKNKRKIAIYRILGFDFNKLMLPYFVKDSLNLTISFFVTSFLINFVINVYNSSFKFTISNNFYLINDFKINILIFLIFLIINIGLSYFLKFKISKTNVYLELKEK